MRVTSRLKAALAVALIAATVVPVARAQAPLEDTPIPMWIPEGQVSAAVKVGNTLVVGGNFTYVGPPTGPFAIVDGADATNFNTAAGLTGVVTKVVSDGAGGWFAIVAPPDTSGGGTLVRIAADGRKDAGFVPQLSLQSVAALAVDGGRLYVAGTAAVPGAFVPALRALDPATGASLAWVPASVPTNQITDLVASQGVLYVAIVGTNTSSGLALDGATGAVVPFPALQTGEVAAAIDDRVYVVNRSSEHFTLRAYTRAGIAVASFAPALYNRIYRIVTSAAAVHAIVQDTPGPSPSRVVALAAATGAETWSSSPSAYSSGPTDLALDGITLYVAGGTYAGFTSVARARLDALDAATGAPRAWAPSVGAHIASVAAANGRVALGGRFQSVGGITKRGLVSLDLATGRPTAVQPPDANAITALVASGDLVVATTTFSYEPPAPALPGELFAYSAATGTRYPRVLAVGSGDAFTLAIRGSTLFIGGLFQSIDGQPRRHLAAYNLVTGQVLPWNPDPNDYVYTLKAADSALYVVGRFTALAGAARAGAAAFDAGSLQLTSWDPQVPNIGTHSVDVWQDRVFLGIHVRTEQNLPSREFVRTIAVDRFSGARLNVDLPYGPILAQVAGTVAILSFPRSVPPLPQPRTIDGVTGQSLPWTPSVVDWSSTQRDKLIGLDGYLVLTGSNSVGGRPISNLAVFKPRVVLPGAPRQIQMTVVGSTVSLAWSPGAAPAPLGYVIEAGSAPGLSDLGRFPVGGATQVAAAVAAGSYALRVRAIGASGEGPASSEWRFTTPATPTPPSAPSGLVTSVAGNVVYLAWTAGPGNATTYVVEGGSAPGLSNLGVIAIGSLDTAAAGTVPPGTYHLRVRAANATGSSAPSNEIVVVVPR